MGSRGLSGPPGKNGEDVSFFFIILQYIICWYIRFMTSIRLNELILLLRSYSI